MRLIETLTIVSYTDISSSEEISNTELAELTALTIEPRIGVEAGECTSKNCKKAYTIAKRYQKR